MKTIHINLLDTHKPSSAGTGILIGFLLILSTGITGFNIYTFSENQAMMHDYHKRLMNETRQLKPSPYHFSKEAADQVAAEIGYANSIIAENAFPWMSVMNAIELSLNPGITLTGARFTPRSETITLTGQASSASPVSELLKAIIAQPALNINSLRQESLPDVITFQVDIRMVNVYSD